MSINKALANSMSGLSANSRLAEIVSRNVANAATEGYAARSLTLSNRVIADVGSGVKVDGPMRAGDAFLTADRRRGEAQAEAETASAMALRALSDMLTPQGGGALSDAYTKLDNALRALSDTPESPAVQTQAVDAARVVARTLNDVSSDARRVRIDADAQVARLVDQVNAALKRVEALNREIRDAVATGRDPTPMEDERDRQINIVNGIVPIRAQPRSDSSVALVSQGGAVLLDGGAQQLSFTAATGVTPDMTREGGGLSGITLHGRDMTPPEASGGLSGGALETAVRVRDEYVPEMSAQLDALARDLIERFQDPAVDPTIGAPDTAGLFVDSADPTVAFDAVGAPESQIDLASRIALNANVDPRQGGEIWRIRDGVNATAEGAAGSSAIPRALVDAFGAERVAAAPVKAFDVTQSWERSGFGVPRSANALVEAVTAVREARTAQSEQSAAFARANAETLRGAELRVTAVDTDKELQDLLEIEKSYAANARVLSVIDDLLNRILEI